jgi:hypothetical protein
MTAATNPVSRMNMNTFIVHNYNRRRGCKYKYYAYAYSFQSNANVAEKVRCVAVTFAGGVTVAALLY